MRYFLIFILLLHTLVTKAQTDTLSCIVVDKKGEGLPGVSVYLLRTVDTVAFLKCSKVGQLVTFTDAFGNFSLIARPEDLPEYVGVSASDYEPSVAHPSASRILMIQAPDLQNKNEVPPSGPLITKESYVTKPAIYLYPAHETTVTVKHVFKGTIGTTYPAYNDGWEVVAQPDGSLRNTKDGRLYEYLFWDGKYRFPDAHFNFKTGFVVKKAATQEFLWEKLALIGFNNKEINDFVVYWLPQLEHNEANFIHFRINDDIDHSSTLTVTPQPDSRIRLYMEFKPVDPKFSIPPQNLQPLSRKGFTLVEWGGARLGEGPLSLQ